MSFEKDIQPFGGQPLTQQVLMSLLKDYQWPHNKIKDLVSRGILIPIKRGLYITGPQLGLPQPSLFLLANHIYGPSYVSVEAALSYWSLIPEKVTAISSITTGVVKSFHTRIGTFNYIHAKLPYYSFGIQQVTTSDKQSVLIASKEKALCDKIVTTTGILLRSIQQTMSFLVEDLRIEKDLLRTLDIETINSWIDQAPKKQSLSILVKTLQGL